MAATFVQTESFQILGALSALIVTTLLATSASLARKELPLVSIAVLDFTLIKTPKFAGSVRLTPIVWVAWTLAKFALQEQTISRDQRAVRLALQVKL